ncbi:STAS domain-containing protein [Saprospira sp. CCB-QB6]|uniref:STAS domain-containing protein n=1 Tax=Saprospira sp. CCB-QB6 TaxID=3023936 RepID=UPI00234B68A8|nr:STAS domain-containing protein [Saprospira sp. CCB-QB6]WCL83060.1 STAS domain-containing protein [Saprospira sp. CCB-QB6]
MIAPKRDLLYYKRQYFITALDLAHLAQSEEQMEVERRAVFDELYAWMRQHEEFAVYYPEELIMGLSASEELFWANIIGGRFNEEYIATERAYGLQFAQTGIPLDAYIAVLLAFHEFTYQAYQRQGLASVERVMAYKKLSQASIEIITEVYSDIIQQQLEEQNEALRELSTPVAEIWDGILLLPLVGFIDSKRAKDMMETMLFNVAEKQAKVFILDISGVAIVDTAVANHLIKMTKAGRLMGCDCIISGISGSIAQTIVELGIQIDEIQTTGSMRDALAQAMRQTQ